MRACRPAYLYPTHFGIKDDAEAHFDSLDEHIHRIAEWMRQEVIRGTGEATVVQRFQAFMDALLASHGLDEEAIQDYEIADPAFMSVNGLARYWKKGGLGPVQSPA
jgi:hypothetical protein